MSKTAQYIYPQSIDGVPKMKLAQAIEKVRISEGITPALLAQDVGVKRSTLDGTNLSIASNETLHTVVKTLSESTKLGINTAADVIRVAEGIPDISHEAVDAALQNMARAQGLSRAEVERRTHELMFDAPEKNVRKGRPAAFETEYYKAKVLGCSSLGDLLVKSGTLPPEINDAVLVPAVETLRHERGIMQKEFAHKIGSEVHCYRDYIAKSHFTVAARAKLPAAFDLDSHQAILDEVAKLEPLPDRKTYGEAVYMLRKQQHISRVGLAEELGCSFTTIDAIEKNRQEFPASSAWLRKIPSHLGCNTMQEVIEKAKDLPKVPARRTVLSKQTSTTATSGQQPAEGGTWVDFVNAVVAPTGNERSQ